MISRNDYDSFGEIVSSTGLTQNAVTYTGQRLDVESGLMALGNGERYYNPSYGRFIQQDSYAGMPDMPQSLNRFSYGHNNPNKYVDPSGNEGVVADQMRSNVQNGIANTGNETADWWINFGANFVTGFAYDAANTATGGLLGTVDVMVQDISNGKLPNPIDAWQRGGYSATQSQIYTNFAYYSAGAVKGVGNLAYGIATGVPTLAYGLATDFNGTINNMWLGLADKTASVIDTALNPRKALDDLAQHSQEDIAFGLGEVVGETAASAGIAKFGLALLAKSKRVKALSKAVADSKTFKKIDKIVDKLDNRFGKRVSFYTVQNDTSFSRLTKGGEPWGKSLHKANLGEGFYAWGSKIDANAYLNLKLKRMKKSGEFDNLNRASKENLSVREFSITQRNLNKMKKLDISKWSDDAVNGWINIHNMVNINLTAISI